MTSRLRNLLLAFTASSLMWAGIIFGASQAFGADSGGMVFYYTKVFPNPIVETHVPLSLLTRINVKVNESITYASRDKDLWEIAPRFGDCDDYAITKLVRLYEAGVPLSSLRLARGWARGERHMVLLVYTSGGTFRLDNLLSGLGSARGFTPITKKETPNV